MSQKIDQEQLDKISQLQQSYATTTVALGEIKVRRVLIEKELIALDQQEDELVAQYESLRETETQLVQQLNEAYGNGSLDLATGEFTPAEGTDGQAETELAGSATATID